MKARLVVPSAVVSVGLVAAVVVVATTRTNPTAHEARSQATKQIEFAGYHTEVPASWPVYDLRTDPNRCVRFDQHAVYLGTPGRDQKCPARAVGRTEALLIEPLASASAPAEPGVLRTNLSEARVSVTASYLQDEKLAASFVTDVTDGRNRRTTAGATTTTATPGPTGPTPTTSPSASDQPSSSDTPTPSAEPTTPPPTATPSQTASTSDTPTPSTEPDPTGTAPADTTTPTPTADPTQSESPTTPPTEAEPSATPTATTSAPAASAVPTQTPTPTPTASGPLPTTSTTVRPTQPTLTEAPSGTFEIPRGLYTEGQGFDTCEAPSITALTAWAPTELNALGIYVGGANRACGNVNLTADWVRRARGLGYTFLPTYVGLQAPCITRNVAKIDPKQAAAQGAAAADDAVARMRLLGLGTGNPIYLDMEQYSGDAACTTAVLTFTTGFVRRAHALRYTAGFYSNAGSGIHDLAVNTTSTSFTMPDAVWIARWDGMLDVNAKPYAPDNLWVKRRTKQYEGDHVESHGGVSINIDSNFVVGVTARPGDY